MSARILVVDDEPALRRTLERALRTLKLEVVTVGDPQLAYEMLDASEFDLVLLDIHLPQMSGDTLFLALVRRWPRLLGRVMLMTGDPWAINPDWPPELLSCPVLAKPFTLDQLGDMVLTALAAVSAPVPEPRQRNGHG
ncbi:MAG: response regulator [Gemmatimonadales bacterium]